MKISDIAIGSRFGSLVVLAFEKRKDAAGNTRTFLACSCDCGNRHSLYIGNIGKGKTTSCGCVRYTNSSNGCSKRVDGMKSKDHPLYATWKGMKARTSNPKHPAFSDYGARGIKVCSRWRDSFEAFASDMGARPAGTSIDRIDNDGDYCPENCRWAKPVQQSNNSRHNITLECRGLAMTISQWSETLQIGRHTISARLRRGWDVEKALFHEVDPKYRHVTGMSRFGGRVA